MGAPSSCLQFVSNLPEEDTVENYAPPPPPIDVPSIYESSALSSTASGHASDISTELLTAI